MTKIQDNKNEYRRVGLVFSGGGGKGAYQIGVWKALRQFGVDKFIKAVSGTSVGSLNMALFLQGDYELAEEIWMNITPDKILTTDAIKNIFNTLKFILSPNLLLKAIQISGDGFFTKDGLLGLINQLDLEKISNSDIFGFATCCSWPLLQLKYFEINSCSPYRLKNILCATSSLPFVFGKETIDGKDYLDGGTRGFLFGKGSSEGYDNIPIKPLYDLGCDIFFVVHLSRDKIINRIPLVLSISPYEVSTPPVNAKVTRIFCTLLLELTAG